MVRSLLSATLARAAECESGEIRDARKPACSGGTTCRLEYRARQTRISPKRTPEADCRRPCGERVERVSGRADAATANDWKNSMDSSDRSERTWSNEWTRELTHTFSERPSRATPIR